MPVLKILFAALLLPLAALAVAGDDAGPSGKAAATPSLEPLRGAIRPIAGTENDFSDIAAAAAAAGARRILLGESTHGTHEYYRERARLTERLIRDHGVNAVAIEGDWSATQRVNLYVRGLGADRNADQALRGYTNFPAWMWGNRDFRDFVERLRALNLERPAERRVGLYGMDVYDLFDAARAVQAYLAKAAPGAARRAAGHYRCFARHRGDRWAYGLATRNSRNSCRTQAEAVLAEVRRLPRPADPVAAEAHFGAVRSAASVAAAEEYFRTASVGSLAWNVRDRHMADNVDEIAEHVEASFGRPAKLVLWSHNTHSGDARATFAADRGELNLGQLMRQRHGNAAFLVGFFSHSGTVFAAPEWDSPGKRYDMRPALAGSYSALFNASAVPAFSLLIRGNSAASKLLAGPMLERAIGVVYLPHSERSAHYFDAKLAEQFDAIVYFDRTRAVTPL
ncbi:MAG TPA: erythromycin esterase family protein [Allosphingosinicella sp.]|jgi:erythromycin esterase-like protein